MKISKTEKVVFYLTALLVPCLLSFFHFYADFQKDIGIHIVAIYMYIAFLPGGIMSLITAKRYGFSSRMGKAFIFFGLSLISMFLGLFGWFYYSFFTDIEPYPTLAELAFILTMPFMVIGMSYIIALYKISITPVKIIIPAIVSLVWITFAIKISEFSLSDSLSGGFDIVRITETSYLISDAVTIGFGVFLLFLMGGKISASFRAIAVGFVFFGMANAIFFWQVWNTGYSEGGISDQLYTLAGVIMSIGVIHAYRKNAPSPDSADAL